LEDEPTTPTVAAVTVSGRHLIPVIRIPALGDYGPVNALARRRVSLAKVRTHFAPVPRSALGPALNDQVKPTSTPPPGASAPVIPK
jgi:hypothetical protein